MLTAAEQADRGCQSAELDQVRIQQGDLGKKLISQSAEHLLSQAGPEGHRHLR